jgi:hypothetical protein
VKWCGPDNPRHWESINYGEKAWRRISVQLEFGKFRENCQHFIGWHIFSAYFPIEMASVGGQTGQVVASSVSIARLPGSGAIAARGTISGYDVGLADRTDDTAIYDFLPDGTGIYRFTIVASGFPADFRNKLRTHHEGATFPNGSREIILAAAHSSGSRELLTENLNHGQYYGGVTVVNPFL